MEGTLQRHSHLRVRHFWLGSLLLLFTLGCQPKEEDQSSGDVKSTSGQQLANRSGQENSSQEQPSAAAPRKPVPREYVPGPGPAAFKPHVVFTSGMQALNPVGVGDVAPAFTLPNGEGEEVALGSLLGQKLTLLIFWKSDEVFSIEEIARLERDVLSKYSGVGLEVVTVHVGETTPQFEEIIAAVQPRFNVLVDTQGTAIRQYGLELFPRTYLLDAQGNILWFDIEYSRSTKREMDNAIRYYLLDSQ